ncbi:hypothetical protein AAFF_G00237190 [Aldrovandia affinis]|uniref:Uncharacterized protein n=1 Tax=Aldrovandia affinis TaxID=143900 RepID=A0AAD7REL5_9TELE|nr:hypothetical protein AAFF_G00237190 [Aldrovandia affinis]
MDYDCPDPLFRTPPVGTVEPAAVITGTCGAAVSQSCARAQVLLPGITLHAQCLSGVFVLSVTVPPCSEKALLCSPRAGGGGEQCPEKREEFTLNRWRFYYLLQHSLGC